MTLALLHHSGILIAFVTLSNVGLALWAGWSALRRRRTLPAAFWALVLITAAVLVLQSAPGLLLLLMGSRPRTSLHLLYAALVTTGALVQIGLRPRGSLRRLIASTPQSLPESRVMGLLCLTEAALLMRAWMTGITGR